MLDGDNNNDDDVDDDDDDDLEMLCANKRERRRRRREKKKIRRKRRGKIPVALAHGIDGIFSALVRSPSKNKCKKEMRVGLTARDQKDRKTKYRKLYVYVCKRMHLRRFFFSQRRVSMTETTVFSRFSVLILIFSFVLPVFSTNAVQ